MQHRADRSRRSTAALAFLLAGCGTERPPEVAALVPCLAATSDFRPIAPTTEFPGGGQWLGAVFALGEGETCARLLHVWTVVDVGAVAPPGREIARSELLLGGARRGRVSYQQEVPLPEGRYRLDVSLDQQPWRSVELRVVADPTPLPILHARELMPLTEGVYWDYEFRSHPGDGSDDAPGARHAVRVQSGAADSDGRHLRFLRDGELVHEEWWRFTDQGLVATRRRTGGAETVLDPPQILLPLPRSPMVRWDYASRDGGIRQSCRCFGPRPVLGPEGEAEGYVVVVEQRDPDMEVSSERHFLPGFGLVREEIVYSQGGVRQLRQVMTIRPKGT